MKLKPQLLRTSRKNLLLSLNSNIKVIKYIQAYYYKGGKWYKVKTVKGVSNESSM